MGTNATWQRGREGPPPINTSRKVSVAVAVFHNDDRLMRAIDDLLRLEPTGDQLVVLAHKGALDGRLDSAGGLANSVQIVDPQNPLEDGPVDGDLKQQALHFAGWIPERLSAVLRTQLADGGCVLFVEIQDDDWGRRVCEVLLQHSVDSVQFHEFTRRA